jgi:hypothetical protein
MTKDTGTKQLGPSTAEHGRRDDHDFRTIPIFFARMPQTGWALCRILSLIQMLWNAHLSRALVLPGQGWRLAPIHTA